MDPLVILVASIFIILLTSLTVNFYYICRYYSHHTNSTSSTQTARNFSTDAETQINNQKPPVGVHDQSIQNVQTMRTVGAGNSTPVQVERYIQMDKVYYISLPEQLDQILAQLKTNRTDLNHCMEWVGECEKATLTAAQAVDKQSQTICNIHETIQADVHQELQCQHTDILQDM